LTLLSLLLLLKWHSERWKARATLCCLRNAVQDHSLGLSLWRRAVCARDAAIGYARIIRARTCGQGDEVRGQFAAVLGLERIPRTEQVRLLLLVLEEVDDEAND
jgi:hypothetical protein